MKTARDLKPVYLIYGVEKFLLDEALDRLKKTIATGGDLVLNYEKIQPPLAADRIIDACLTTPFLAERRLIVVEDFETMTSADKNKLADYIRDPSPHTVLVLVQAGAAASGKAKVDKRSRLFKETEVKGQAYEYKLDFATLNRWIKDSFLKRNKVATDEAVAYLIEALPNDLWRLESEIEKVSLYAEETKKIDVDTVKQAASPSPEAGVFDLISAVTSGDQSLALTLLARILDGKDTLGKVFYLLEDQFRLIMKIKALVAEGISDKEAAAALRISTGRLFYLKKQNRSLTATQLKSALNLIAAADFERKTGRQEPRLILERLIVDIASTQRI